MGKEVVVNEILKFYHFARHAGYVFDGHTHADREFKFVINGSLEVTYENIILIMSPGDCLLCEPYAFHREKTLSDGTEYINIHFKSDSLEITGKAKTAVLRGNDLILMNLILSELEAQNSAFTNTNYDFEKYNFTVKKLFEALLYRIIRSNDIPVFSVGKKSFIYNQAINFMRENRNKNLTVEQIAHQCGVCPTVLKSIFNEFTGHGVGRHFLNMRIELAKMKLLQNVPVSAISESMEFSSQAYFTQCFKRECGLTPSEFKKQNMVKKKGEKNEKQ